MLIQRQRGVTLLELVIGVAIISILLGLALPSFSGFMRNTQTRAAAESILNGIQLARSEAVRRNVPVRFDLTDAGGRVAWKYGCVRVEGDCVANLGERVAAEAGNNGRVGVSKVALAEPPPANAFSTAIGAGVGLPAGITFNGMGRVVVFGGADLTRIDITSAAQGAGDKRYVVKITQGGDIRMCDPTLVFANNPQGCS